MSSVEPPSKGSDPRGPRTSNAGMGTEGADSAPAAPPAGAKIGVLSN